jgi:succinyl-CoA synthetase alpha subunit
VQDLILAERLPVMVQGITGRTGRQHAVAMRAYGTNVVAGVGRAVGDIDGIPAFLDCATAVAATGAQASVVLVPPLGVRAAVSDAMEAGVRLVVCVTEGVPIHDSLAIVRRARETGTTWIGPSAAGMAIPGRMKLGFLPDVALRPGPLGVMSKSGTLAYELCWRLAERRIGQSIWVGVGGDPVKGTRFADLLPLFAKHDGTKAVLVLGEIGGSEEEDLADQIKALGFSKPVHVLLAGASAPEGVTMGHAGAMVDGSRGTLASKTTALRDAGASIYSSMDALTTGIVKTLRS